MNYLQDRKSKRNKFFIVMILVIALICFVFFQKQVFKGLSSLSHTVFRPVIVMGNNIGRNFSNLGFYFSQKKRLAEENELLRIELGEKRAALSNHNTIVDENIKLKESLSRLPPGEFVLAAILSKSPKSPFDTLLLDAGEKDGVSIGSMVFAKGGVPIGKISSINSNSATAVLFSTPGEKTEVVLSGSDVYLEAIGRGGGNFEINIPRDFEVPEGGEAVMPGITPHTLAIFEKVVSDPRDSFAKAIFVSPVNIQELKFVEVRK